MNNTVITNSISVSKVYSCVDVIALGSKAPEVAWTCNKVYYLRMRANNTDVEKIRTELMSELVVKCAQRHNTLGDLSSMKVCYLLRQYPNLSVSEVAGFVGLSVSATSRCLSKLKAADIVSSNKMAQTVRYKLNANPYTNHLLMQLEGKG